MNQLYHNFDAHILVRYNTPAELFLRMLGINIIYFYKLIYFYEDEYSSSGFRTKTY